MASVSFSTKAPVNSSPARTVFELSEYEREHYNTYSWCLNAFPTVNEAIQHLDRELKAGPMATAWQAEEKATNVYLLACAISDTVDDYLLGRVYDFARAAAVVPGGSLLLKVHRAAGACWRGFRSKRLARLYRWRNAWEETVVEFLRQFHSGDSGTDGKETMRALLNAEFLSPVLARRCKIPAAFRSQDLTEQDILELGRKFVSAHPDRDRPILVLGFRTAGSYFAPLIRACLRMEGFSRVDSATMWPKKTLGPREQAKVARCAAHDGLVLLVDEPANTGSSLAKAVGVLGSAGVSARRIVAAFPVHPSRRDWGTENPITSQLLDVITLGPEEWYKQQLLEPSTVEETLSDYVGGSGATVRVVSSTAADDFNENIENLSEHKFHNRLKRVYEVQIANGRDARTRYVFAKSVGWGWLGYHAFIGGERLAGFVPNILGLRKGILYSEWNPQSFIANIEADRESVIETAPRYIAARARKLALTSDPSADLARENDHKASEELSVALARSYGFRATAILKRARVRRELSRRLLHRPVLIDGKMRPAEWIATLDGLIKADFEHHGMGKTELNVTDPAYDLAETILFWKLSAEEERQLVASYVQESGDTDVQQRLMLNKLLAGIRCMQQATDNMNDPRLLRRHPEFSRSYQDALSFLTIHTARYCGSLCPRPKALAWRGPLLALDVDGVLDKGIFGFPSTTAAGIEAMSLVHSHDIPAVLNTARSASELKEYCRAFHLLGGVAEYGSYAWDAVNGTERVLVSEEALTQLRRVKSHLPRIPGVFLSPGYEYSLKAFVYSRGVTVPLPDMMIRDLLGGCRADRLIFHQTFTDTTVISKQTDKGRGLVELLGLTEQKGIETIAVGDSAPDLATFRVASRSFAPSNISCRPAAKLIGCKIASQPFQRGLREIVRMIAHPDGLQCDRCARCSPPSKNSEDIFLRTLAIADESPIKALARAIFDPLALEVFTK